MALTVSDRLLTVGRGRDREGLMPAIAGRDRTVRGLIRSAGRPGLVPISQPRQHWEYPIALYNRAVLPHKTTTKLLIFVFSFDFSNKLNDPIVERLFRSKSRVFNDIHIRINSDMKVSSETSDTQQMTRTARRILSQQTFSRLHK